LAGPGIGPYSCLHDLLLPGLPLLRRGRQYVAAEAEEVHRIVAVLERYESLPDLSADRSLNEEQLATARESLDERAWEEAWAEGRAMTTEEAVAYALEGQNPESSRSSLDEARKA
jgi:hypothetical protein